jgi:hypothetical protein
MATHGSYIVPGPDAATHARVNIHNDGIIVFTVAVDGGRDEIAVHLTLLDIAELDSFIGDLTDAAGELQTYNTGRKVEANDDIAS